MKINADIISILVKAMNANIKNAGICTHCFDTIKVMISNNGKLEQRKVFLKKFSPPYCTYMLEDNKTLIRTSRGIEGVINAINTHMDNVYTCLYGCNALALIVNGNSTRNSHYFF